MTKDSAKKVKDPLFHIIKRPSIVWWKGILIRVVAIIIALIVVALITLIITGQNPIEMYKAIIDGAIGNELRVWNLLQDTALLLIVGLALTLSFKMRFWNIGGQGQIIMGAIAATACMKFLPGKVPDFALYIIMIVTALIAGGIWALIPGLFKAFLNTNETLFTLMMNYIALNFAAFLTFRWSRNSGNDVIGVLNRKTRIGWFPDIGGEDFVGKSFILNILIVVVLMFIVYVYLKYSKHGYEISVVGESEKTAKYIGINVKKVIIRTVVISGAICGLAGLILVSGVHHTLTTDIEGGRGFTAIIVSWMAHFNPLYMALTSFLIVFLEKGAIQVASSPSLNLDNNFANIVTGILILFIIGCEFFINYKIVFRKRKGGVS